MPAPCSSSSTPRTGTIPLELIGDGLLPPDIDGNRRPTATTPAPIVGTQDDGGRLRRDVRRAQHLGARGQMERDTRPPSLAPDAAAVASFDSIFPCAPTAADCLPQPGIADPNQYLDILSYRQRPTCRLAYRNFGKYEALVTNQSVEALPGIAGPRWYEIRRDQRRLLRPPAARMRRTTASTAGWAASRMDQNGQHGPRLQRRQRRRRVPGHPLHGPAGRRPARPDDARRGDDHQRDAACRRRSTPAGATTRQ